MLQKPHSHLNISLLAARIFRDIVIRRYELDLPNHDSNQLFCDNPLIHIKIFFKGISMNSKKTVAIIFAKLPHSKRKTDLVNKDANPSEGSN